MRFGKDESLSYLSLMDDMSVAAGMYDEQRRSKEVRKSR